MKTEALKILIVDDTPDNLVALEALLRRADVELIAARSGAEALEHCLTHEIALALLDVQMPEMDGFELAELMRGAERTKRVPIIFVTAGARDQARMFRGYESGAVDFLYKPIDVHVLSSKVNVFLDLARQRRELTEILQVNEMFVGIVGHDLRNPLAALIAGTDVLAATLTEPMHLRVLERMKSSGQRMQEMIAQLLDLTHARFAPNLGLARTHQEVDLDELIARIIDELRVAHKRDIALEIDGSCVASGDPDRLAQLFSNLLGNAVKHGKPGPIVTRLSMGRGEAVVEIHNNGAIPAETAATLFEPFKRPRGLQGGLGLGLFIASQVAKSHGGDIEVESAERTGTKFTVRIPCAARHKPDSA